MILKIYAIFTTLSLIILLAFHITGKAQAVLPEESVTTQPIEGYAITGLGHGKKIIEQLPVIKTAPNELCEKAAGWFDMFVEEGKDPVVFKIISDDYNNGTVRTFSLKRMGLGGCLLKTPILLRDEYNSLKNGRLGRLAVDTCYIEGYEYKITQGNAVLMYDCRPFDFGARSIHPKHSEENDQ